MPFAPNKPCAKCKRKLAVPGSPYCKAHQNHSKKQHDIRRGSAAARGYDAEWRKVRAAKLRETPLCECKYCKKRPEVVKRATMVHHDKPVADFPELRLVWENLESMANDCHERIENERGKRWN